MSETNIASREGYKSNIYTDLAIEAANEADKDGAGIKGVEISSEKTENAEVTWVKVTTEDGAKAIGKPVGTYVTVESAALKDVDIDEHEKITVVLAETLEKLVNLPESAEILVAGLGNRMVTPDALGPRSAGKILTTRHIMDELPEADRGKARPVAVITPGVMGTTGVETREIVKGVCSRVNPSLVIVIDALAARAVNRLNATIQIADSGLSPGAGMAYNRPDGVNARKALNADFLGIPVIAIGVPTVVDAATLVNDSLDLAIDEMIKAAPESAAFYSMLKNLRDDEKYSTIKNILEPYSGNMFVTPKEVDEVIDRLSNIIANAVNIALHPGMTIDDINRFMY